MAPAPSVYAAAHGRVNLIGEHTDYNGGFVLPTTIPQRTEVELTRRADHTVRASSANSEVAGEYTLGQERPRHDWLDYLQGVTWALRTADAVELSGFDLSIASNVPLGAGLSSSAALEVSVLRAIREAFDLPLDDIRVAQLGQKAENDFVGARSGIMDQMAATFADERSALFLDTRTLEYRRVPLPAGADLIVIHSGVEHEISRGDYNTRRAECEEAARQLGVPQLRDLSFEDLPRIEQLPEPLGRRARHVLTEDQRVVDAVAALDDGNLMRLGDLFYASHASMRDDFEVSVPEIDLMVELASADSEIYGARMTGGGFGGSVVMLTRGGRGREVGERMARLYAVRSGRKPSVLVPPGQI